MVVAYNPTLLIRYNAHINVEYCSHIGSIKYLYYYLHKGHDRAQIKIDKNKNKETQDVCEEITNYLDTRYIGPIEVACRILELPMSGRSHAVYWLAIHTENQQGIIFEEYKVENILSKNNNTTLTAYFELNKIDKKARNMKYVNIPTKYYFEEKFKVWKERKRYLIQ